MIYPTVILCVMELLFVTETEVYAAGMCGGILCFATNKFTEVIHSAWTSPTLLLFLAQGIQLVK